MTLVHSCLARPANLSGRPTSSVASPIAPASLERPWRPRHTGAARGIDCEPARPLPTELIGAILTARERFTVAQLRESEERPWERIIFSAKESLFKTWFPLRRTRLGFDEAEVALQPDGTFQAEILVLDTGPHPRTVFGRWRIDRGLIVTGLALPAP
ncbi:4'-phosphopantetheinyl transferase superfamily protein [Janibacter limosus]|uniref:4'-phosphopantetheinyl transferase superfamily protein n=1 Tax=Janibacter limosus TaxID=53458 RepID=A0AC61U8U1_9MICO|nr:4'-phosphopantetheinyl transferase superfamily protein [Janibacter limosus]UUZ46449.1 4'-phosphopantetheinyl transferase superfamily protein [Janibacter limosus]